MTWSIDARIPVRFGALIDAGADDALLIEGPGSAARSPSAHFEVASPGHQSVCACCLPRSPVATALAGLFQARAKGEVAYFRRVLAVTSSPEGDTAVCAALRADPLVSGRFRAD